MATTPNINSIPAESLSVSRGFTKNGELDTTLTISGPDEDLLALAGALKAHGIKTTRIPIRESDIALVIDLSRTKGLGPEAKGQLRVLEDNARVDIGRLNIKVERTGTTPRFEVSGTDAPKLSAVLRKNGAAPIDRRNGSFTFKPNSSDECIHTVMRITERLNEIVDKARAAAVGM